MGKKQRKLIAVVLTAALAIGSLIVQPVNITQAATKKVTAIKLNGTKKIMFVGNTITLKIKKVTPAKGSKAVTWKSSNKRIASVTLKGKVTAKKAGTAKITATSKSNKKVKATCVITVKKKLTETSTPTIAVSNIPMVTNKTIATNKPTIPSPSTQTGHPQIAVTITPSAIITITPEVSNKPIIPTSTQIENSEIVTTIMPEMSEEPIIPTSTQTRNPEIAVTITPFAVTTVTPAMTDIPISTPIKNNIIEQTKIPNTPTIIPDITISTITPTATAKIPTEEEAYNKMISMKKKYPEGMTWTNDNYYKSKSENNFGGYGCVGFALMLSDSAFEELPFYEHENFDNIKVGDIIRINNDSHSITVLQIDAEKIVIAEGNYNQSIHWGSIISLNQIKKIGNYIWTRYPTSIVIKRTSSPTTTAPTETGATITPGVIDTSNMPQPTTAIPTVTAPPIQGDIVHSGAYGGTYWTIDKNGFLEVKGIGDMFYENITSETYPTPEWIEYNDEIKSAKIEVIEATSATGLFSQCKNLTSVDLSNLDTSKINSMFCMFNGCSRLTNLDLSNFDTSKVTIMDCMFWGCSSLTNIDLSNFNTSSLEYMAAMFFDCKSLKNVNLSSFDTSKVKIMYSLFIQCENLEEVDLSSFDTSNVTTMNAMFGGCYKLKKVNLNNFNTANVTEMAYMFGNCRSLKELNISNFDLSNVQDIEKMFEDCENLNTIYTPKKSVEKVPDLPEGTWKDANDNIYTTLPQNATESIVLTKN